MVGGGVSKKADKFLPLVDIDTEIIPATLRNAAGIVGAALVRLGWPASRTDPVDGRAGGRCASHLPGSAERGWRTAPGRGVRRHAGER